MTKHLPNKIIALLTALLIVANLMPAINASGQSDEQNGSFEGNQKNAVSLNGANENGTAVEILGYSAYVNYTDTGDYQWAKKAIDYVTVNEYMVGVGDNKFGPEYALTKAQIITVLYKLARGIGAGMPSSPYTDVPSGAWYDIPVRWAHNNSLAQLVQYSGSLLCPNQSVTRVQIAMLLWELAMKYGWARNMYPSVPLLYTDIGGLGLRELCAVKWCYYSGLMTGTSDTTFSPKGYVNRAQMAQMCYKLDKFIAENRAFLVGTDYTNSAPGYNSSEWVDTSMIPRNTEKYYRQMKYNTTICEAPNTQVLKSHHLKSKIVFLAGHGCTNYMYFNHKQAGGYYDVAVGSFKYDTSTNTTYVGLFGNMDFVDLIVLMGCNTAKEADNPKPEPWDDSLTQLACKFGAKVAIGWTDSIYFNEARAAFAENFSKELAAGRSIKTALHNATNNYSYRSGSNVEKWAVYYNDRNKYVSGSMALQVISGMTDTTDGDVPENLLTSFAGNRQVLGEDVCAETASILREIDETFNPDDYAVHIYDHNDGSTTIVFVELVGGFETESEYRVGLEDNQLVSVRKNTREIPEAAKLRLCRMGEQLGISPHVDAMKSLSSEEPPAALSEALRIARELTQSSPEKEVAQQRYSYYYDIEQDRASIVVYTEYYYDDTEAMGVDLYEYDLEESEGTQ